MTWMRITTDELRDQFYAAALQRHGVPEHLRSGLVLYVVDGYLPGDFLTAVLTNDLAWAVARADDESLAGLKAVMLFLWTDVPSPAWGSRLKVEQWCEAKRDARKGGRELIAGESHG